MSRGEPVAQWLQRTQQEQAQLRSALTASMGDTKARSITIEADKAERVIEALKYAANEMKISVKIKYLKSKSKIYFWIE